MPQPLVALQATMPQFEDPVTLQTKAYSLRDLAAKAQAADQSRTDDQAARAAFAANPTDGAARLSALAGVSPAAYSAEAKRQADLDKSGAETRAKQLETAHKQIDLAGQAFGYVRQFPTKENAAAAVNWLGQNGVLTPDHVADHLAKIDAATPEQIQGLATQAFQSAVAAKDQLSKIETKDAGGQIITQGTNPITNQTTTLSTLAKTQSPDNIATNQRIAAEGAANRQSQQSIAGARLAFDKSKEEGNTPSDLSEATVDAIGQGRMKAPTGYALRNPKMANLMDRVNAKYADFDATEYDAKQKAMRDFSTGTQGNSIRSFATATNHLAQLDQLVDALDNGNVPLINKISNTVAQATGSVAPTNFDAAKGIVAKEVLKSIVAGGGGVEERQELAHLLDNAKTTKQLKGVIRDYSHLMEAQKDNLIRQYELSTGRKDAKKRFAYTAEDAASPSGKPVAAGGVVDFGSLK
jgi:hypothetical protein